MISNIDYRIYRNKVTENPNNKGRDDKGVRKVHKSTRNRPDTDHLAHAPRDSCHNEHSGDEYNDIFKQLLLLMCANSQLVVDLLL